MKLLRSSDPALRPSAARRRLMVVERGASLSCRDDASEFDETTALTQLAGETAGELAQRALARLALAERSGKLFDSVLLAVSEGGTGSARRLIGLGVSSHGVAQGCSSELVIMAPSAPTPELREQLLLLTDELLFGAERRLRVRLCFSAERESEQRSGTFWSLPENGDGAERG